MGGVVAACAVIALVITLVFSNSDRICGGVTVSGVAVGGMPKEEAATAVRRWARDRVRRNITLTALDRRWTGNLASLGMRIDWQESVERAYGVGRRGGILNRIVCVLAANRGCGKLITARPLVNQDLLDRTLRKVALAVNRPHTDARLVVVEGQLRVKQDASGIKLDRDAAADVVTRAAGTGRNFVALPIVVDPPEVTSGDCAAINTQLSSYSTSFQAYKRGRTHNLTLAARAIDGIVVKPGREFSVNAAVGPRLAGRGYQMAQVYIRGELVDGIGGGVCQVSSTLFNAVLLAGLQVVERHPHPEAVPYVAPGRDATVAWGFKDFRFRNSASSPVGIIAIIKGSRLIVQIYGAASDKKPVRVYFGSLRRTAAGVKTVVDAKLAPGVRKVVDKGISGASAVLYRKMIGPDGKETTDAFRSRYAPHNAVIAVGAVPATASD